jgi:hypothetical protein
MADDAPLADLDFEQIGRALVMLVPTSASLRHASVISTLRDYIHPKPGSEGDFVRDLFLLPLDDVADKWYGGRLNASRISAVVMDGIIARLAGDRVARATEP